MHPQAHGDWLVNCEDDMSSVGELLGQDIPGDSRSRQGAG